MVYLIVILLFILLGLFYVQYKQDCRWQAEMALQQSSSSVKMPSGAKAVAAKTMPFELLSEHEIITLADAERNVQIAMQPVPEPHVILTDLDTPTNQDERIISFEEAKRYLNSQDKKSIDINNQKDTELFEEITLNDIDIPRAYARRSAKIAQPRVDATTNSNILSNMHQDGFMKSHQMQEEGVLQEAFSSETQTIDITDIQESLARQRLAHMHKQRLAAVDSNKSSPVIADDEVWANLSNRVKSRHRTTQDNHATTALKRSAVDISQAVVTPEAPFPELQRVDPVNTELRSNHAEAFAADFFNTPAAKRYADKVASKAVVPPAEKMVSHDEEALSLLNEEDFEQYYQEQSQKDQNSLNQPSIETVKNEGYILPPLGLLLPPLHNQNAEQSPESLLDNSITIEDKLAEYKVKVKVLDAYAGPVITRYEIEPDVGVRGNSVINLEKDLARSLGVAAIRVVETIPGKTCMGLELPNPKRQIIRLREVFDSPEFANSQSKLTLALGQDISGEPMVTDLAKAPHLLVAGTTGSGKSVGVNSMILSMLYKASPEEVRMIMIDPKMLELSIYEGIPHLLAPVVTDMKLAANALNWCVGEMEKRYRLMSHVGVRNLAGYNDKIVQAKLQGKNIPNPFSYTPDDPEPLEKLPFIVVVVDEFADLMMVAGKQIEQLIARLAQKARAAGIHLILATQRPSVDVITGLIKANIPTRIAFQVSTKIDSRTILDQSGAENLLGQGDMLFLPPGTGYPQRIHGAFVADDEVHRVVEYLKQFGEPEYIDDITQPEPESSGLGLSGPGERDPLVDQAVEVILRTKKATISSLQRHLRIGYNKAATIIEQLEEEGIVSAADHTGKRTILVRQEN